MYFILLFLKSDDAYVDLNTLGEAINRVKRPLGTRRAPGQHCQHIKLKNPDFRNGMIVVYCIVFALMDANVYQKIFSYISQSFDLRFVFLYIQCIPKHHAKKHC